VKKKMKDNITKKLITGKCSNCGRMDEYQKGSQRDKTKVCIDCWRQK